MSAFRSVPVALAAAAAFLAPAVPAGENADAVNGQTVFEQLCGICHAVTPDGSGPPMGPNLFGVMGRKAGSEPDYAMYSPALKAYGVTWDATTLDEYLNNPANKVPGTIMPVMLPEKKDRTDVIAYLASLE